MLNISIVSIGDEICIGQIINTNAAWIAQKCTELGANVAVHLAVNDSKASIVSALDYVSQASDYVIITGGLGPTHDDITKQVLAEYFSDELIFDETVFKQVEYFFIIRNRVISGKNRDQALIPSRCTPLQNRAGTAPGMLFHEKGRFYVSMPGVPLEMKTLMEDHVLKHIETLIQAKGSEVVKYKTLNTSGIPESHLADLLGDVSLFLNSDDSLAFLPSSKGVRLRIGAKGKSFDSAGDELDRIEKYILSKAKDYVHSYDTGSLSESLGKLLASRNLTLSVAESCTAGMLGAEITSIPGSSKYFLGGDIVYSNASKISRLGVKPATIENHGAVSKETALELAINVRNFYNSSIGISITGIAGPDGGTPEKPVGTIWIALAFKEHAFAELFNLGTDRLVNRERAVTFAMSMLYRYLSENTI